MHSFIFIGITHHSQDDAATMLPLDSLATLVLIYHTTLDSPAPGLRVKGEGQSDEPALQGEDDGVYIPQW